MAAERIDLEQTDVRTLNQRLQGRQGMVSGMGFEIFNAKGRHNLAVGLTEPIEVTIHGHAITAPE
jgi:hypothetical protein